MLVNVMKKIAQQTTEANVPMSIMFGVVKSISPLRILVDNRFHIEGNVIIVPREFQEQKISLVHTHSVSDGETQAALTEEVTILEGLKIGDRVLLLRNYGGQQFLVVGRL